MINMHILNLDANASLPPSFAARNALQESSKFVGNPSSPHSIGRNAKNIIDNARTNLARAIGGEEYDIFFNSGASEGNRWVIDSITNTKKFKIWHSNLEHPSLLRPLNNVFQKRRLIKVLNPEDADVIIATMAHSETGLITDWDGLIKKAKPNAILVSDISQTLGRLDPPPKRIDVLVCSAHKIGAFPGCGAILLRNQGKTLKAPWLGGNQENNLRPGTESIQLIHAFGAAAKEIEITRIKNKKLEPLRNYLEQEILKLWTFAKRTPKTGNRIPNTTAITLCGINSDILRILIDSVGICVGFGTSCSALSPEPSKSLLSFGLTKKEARSTIRFSLCTDANDKIIEEVMFRLKNINLKQCK